MSDTRDNNDLVHIDGQAFPRWKVERALQAPRFPHDRCSFVRNGMDLYLFIPMACLPEAGSACPSDTGMFVSFTDNASVFFSNNVEDEPVGVNTVIKYLRDTSGQWKP